MRLWWLACAPADPTLPPPARAALPFPPDAILEDADCAGTPGTDGYTCGGHAQSPLPMRAAADDAARRMSGWEEYSWDEVPGRIQYTWRRGPEWVSLAVHELPMGTKLSASYTWDADPELPDVDRFLAPGPSRAVPPDVAALGLPDGAVLLGADDRWAVWSFTGDADAWLARAAEGRAVQMRARGPDRRTLIVRDGDREWHAVVKLGADAHRLRVDVTARR